VSSLGPAGAALSPLALLHPDGRVRGTLLLGAGSALLPVPETRAAAPGELDLIVVAPAEEEWAAREPDGWLAELRKLAPDGLVYAIASRRRRRAMRALLLKAGFEIEAEIAHVPGWDARYLVPVAPASAGGFRHVSSVWPRRARALELAPSALGSLLPAVALVARPSSSRRLGDWALRLEPEAEAPALACLIRRGRKPEDRIVVVRTARDGAKASILKIGLAGRARDQAVERLALEQLGPAARAAGANVPEPLSTSLLDDRAILVETALGGRTAAGVLGNRPRELPKLLDRLGAWLERWHRETCEYRVLEPADLDRLVRDPLTRVAGVLDPRYVEWLQGRCVELTGARCAFVAAHNDLTMFNVLVDGDRLGIVDWECARAGDLPLCDLAYAAVDAAAATGRYRDRAIAYERVFGSGPVAAQVEQLTGRICAALDLDDALAQLCLHATWLRHAANEQGDGTPRGFLAILRRLASETVDR
jgi:hypothetical protein